MTIIFTVSVEQSKAIAERLRALGCRAAHVSGETPADERRKLIRDFAAKTITHVVNCMVLTEGFDAPAVDCVVMARPTQSKSLYIQCVGRGLRVYPGKSSCRVVDLVGLSRRHTLIQAPVIFGVEAEAEEQARRQRTADDEIREAHWERILLGQVGGVEAVARSEMRWIRTSSGVLALSCGEGGLLRMVPGSDLWTVEVVGRKDAPGRDSLTTEPVDLEFAQGIAEDYVRRAGTAYLTARSARWRRAPATPSQLDLLRRKGVAVPSDLTKGEASDLITEAVASSSRFDGATPKQVAYLRKLGCTVPDGITKGQAGRMISTAKRQA